MYNVQIISDINKKSNYIKSWIIKLLQKKKFDINNVTIVIGGDGFMLKTLKSNTNSKKVFYGVNSGNYGFLMNKFSSKNFIKNLLSSKITNIYPLEMIVKNKKISSN